ncbi:MAG: hypothetical protein ACRCVV_11010 [Shewanella sp.]
MLKQAKECKGMLNQVAHSKFQEELTKAISVIKTKSVESKPLFGQDIYRFLDTDYPHRFKMCVEHDTWDEDGTVTISCSLHTNVVTDALVKVEVDKLKSTDCVSEIVATLTTKLFHG